jgi:hypothetical protein
LKEGINGEADVWNNSTIFESKRCRKNEKGVADDKK